MRSLPHSGSVGAIDRLSPEPLGPARRERALLLALLLLLASVTAGAQFYYLLRNHPLSYLQTEQVARHLAILNGTAPAPYRYRLLSIWLTSLWMWGWNAVGVSSPVFTWGSLRLLQNIAIFGLAHWYLRSSGFSRRTSVLGLLLLAHGMLFAFGNSDLSIYTYTELLLYLCSAIAVVTGRISAIPGISVLAALNKESGVLVPFVLLAKSMTWRNGRPSVPGPVARYFAISVGSFLAIYVSLLVVVGPSSYATSGYGQVYPGLELLRRNLANGYAWYELLGMYSILPASVLLVRSWPRFLRWCLPFLVVPWFAGQFVFGTVDEGRLFLVPLAVVFIPAALSLVVRVAW